MTYVKLLKILTLPCLLLLYSSTFLIGQEVELSEEYSDEPRGIRLAGLNLNALFPQGNFKRNLGDEKGLGVSGVMLYQTAPMSPHFLGFEVGYDNLYNESSFVNGIEEVINSGYASINFSWRVFPSINFFGLEPYFEAFLGPNFIFTSTNFLDENGESIDFNFNETNFGFEYGIGGGMIFPLGNNWFLDAQFTRTQTSIATYLVLPDPNSSFSEVNSSNDHNRLKLGFLYAF